MNQKIDKDTNREKIKGAHNKSFKLTALRAAA
jgi:hypothetical protein